MAFDMITKEQEAALLALADKELARKAAEDAITAAYATLDEVNSRFLAEQAQVNDGVIAKYSAELRAAQEAITAAKDAEAAVKAPIDLTKIADVIR